VNDLIIVRKEDAVITGMFENNELVEVQVEKDDGQDILGDIYLGKVKNIVANINAAFVQIDAGRMCYLSLDEVKNPVRLGQRSGPVKSGDELIVQITKESSAYKAAQATSGFSITGRNLVLVHGRRVLGISQKIADKDERARLRELLCDLVTDNFGFIVRTNAAGAKKEDIEAEAASLIGTYEEIVTCGIHKSVFARLYSPPPSYIWEIRDLCGSQIDRIVTDDEDIFENVRSYLSQNQPEDVSKLTLFKEGTLGLAGMYGLDGKIEKALEERVWLDSGAYLIIQATEACTVIDVNTGRAIKGRKDQQETFLRINLEAAGQVARQLRLRNLSGIIIVDFIDMESDEHKQCLMQELRSLCKKDRIPTKVVDMTKLNLVEITRKKTRKPLSQQV